MNRVLLYVVLATTMVLVAIRPTVDSCVLGQAARENTVAEAINSAADSGGMVVLLLHGSDWNQTGEDFRRDVFDSKTLERALPEEVVLASVDCKQKPTAAEVELLKGLNRFPAVTIRTYPAILLLDGVGRAVEVIQPVTEYGTPESLANLLAEWHRRLATRDEILVRARAATGVEQARLIGESLRALGVGLGPWDRDLKKVSFHEALAVMKAADPGDESGWILATEFPFDKIAKSTSDLREHSGLAAADAELNKLLENPFLTAEQRQELQRQRFLLYKDDGQPVEKQIELLKAVAAESPESIIGRGAIRWAEHLRANSTSK